MLLKLNLDILQNEIIPLLENQSLGRLSCCCKFLKKVLKDRLFRQRSLFKIRTKRNFWKINLDRFWKEICPIEKRKYHVVCENQHSNENDHSMILSTKKIKSKIDVIEDITIIGSFTDKTILPNGTKAKLSFRAGFNYIITPYFAKIELLDNQYNQEHNNQEHNNQEHNIKHNKWNKKQSENTFVIHLKLDFPILLFYSGYMMTLYVNDILFPPEIESWMISPYCLKHIIIKGYKIDDYICQRGAIPTLNLAPKHRCSCEYHKDIFITIRHLDQFNCYKYNFIHYNFGNITQIFHTPCSQISSLKEYLSPVFIPKNDWIYFL